MPAFSEFYSRPRRRKRQSIMDFRSRSRQFLLRNLVARRVRKASHVVAYTSALNCSDRNLSSHYEESMLVSWSARRETSVDDNFVPRTRFLARKRQRARTL